MTTMAPGMTPVMSPDGTRIAVFVSGHGRPLVVVPGTTSDHTTWRLLAPLLETPPPFTRSTDGAEEPAVTTPTTRWTRSTPTSQRSSTPQPRPGEARSTCWATPSAAMSPSVRRCAPRTSTGLRCTKDGRCRISQIAPSRRR